MVLPMGVYLATILVAPVAKSCGWTTPDTVNEVPVWFHSLTVSGSKLKVTRPVTAIVLGVDKQAPMFPSLLTRYP